MKKEYTEVIESVSDRIADVFMKTEDNLVGRALTIDGDIRDIIREIGLEATRKVLEDTVKKSSDIKKKKKEFRDKERR